MKRRLGFLLTLLICMLLTLWPVWHSWAAWWPDFVWLLLTAWVLQTQERVHLLVVFIIGLYMDLLAGTLLGVHAFVYVFLGYFLLRFAPRWRFYALAQQVMLVFVLYALYLLLMFLILHQLGDWHVSAWYWFGLIIVPVLWAPFQAVIKRLGIVR